MEYIGFEICCPGVILGDGNETIGLGCEYNIGIRNRIADVNNGFSGNPLYRYGCILSREHCSESGPDYAAQRDKILLTRVHPIYVGIANRITANRPDAVLDITAGQIKEMRREQSGMDIGSELGVTISPFIFSAICPVLSDGLYYEYRSRPIPRCDREPACEVDTRRKPPDQFPVQQSTSSVTVNLARSIKVHTVPPSIVI